MAKKRTRNYSYHAKPPPSRTLRFCSSTEALKDRCCWGSIPSVRIAGYTHLISTSSPRATSCCQSTIAAVPAMALTTERPTTSAPAAAASSMTCSAPSPICEADSVVPFQQAAELIEGLRSHNIDHDVIMIPNEIHDMARYSSWMMLFNAADVYFDRHLDKRSAPAP